MKNIIKRRKTIITEIGNLKIGGNYPISLQSMTNYSVYDIDNTLKQINELEDAGCDLVRIAFPDIQSCKLIPVIKKNINIPIMADIHFNHQIALEAIKYNADGIRINPGNIKKEILFNEIIEEAEKRKTLIRFGINAGSLDKKILQKYGEPNYEALVEETEQVIKFLKNIKYKNIIFSIKSSNVMDTIIANAIVAKKCSYPIHIGVTEAGFEQSGTIKSSLGIGILLFDGIGDTIRVSLSGDPAKEVIVGKQILNALEINKRGVNIISCPTCGRCTVDIYKIGKELEKRLIKIKKPFDIAIMGCMVNGPGEAKNADFGIAFNNNVGMLFERGILVGRYNQEESINMLIERVESSNK